MHTESELWPVDVVVVVVAALNTQNDKKGVVFIFKQLINENKLLLLFFRCIQHK